MADTNYILNDALPTAFPTLRGFRGRGRGFTLLEVLVAAAITSILLVGLTSVIVQLRQGLEQLPWRNDSGQTDRALAVMQADSRGVIQIFPLPTTQSDHGQPLAMFLTTWRIDAIDIDHWAGTAQVGYWVQEDAAGGQQLWRSEQPPASASGNGSGTSADGAGSDSIHWTPLLRNIQDIAMTVWQDKQWTTWPVSTTKQYPLRPAALRLSFQPFTSAVNTASAAREHILPIACLNPASQEGGPG